MSKSDYQSVESACRGKYSKLGLQTDYNNSRSAAIHLFCLICMGGDEDARTLAKACQSYECPLWQFRPGAIKNMKPTGIPSQEDYEQAIEAKVSPERREWGKKLGEMRKKK
jgi:hypothetical protein